MVGRSSTSLVPASSTLSGPFAVVLSAGSLPGNASDACALDTTILSSKLAVARLQRNAARQELAFVWSELHRAKDESDELRSALALLHVPFHESRLSLLALMSRPDAITSQLLPSDDKRDGFS